MEHGLCSCLIATRLAFGWFMVPPGGSRMCGDRRSAAPPAHRENYRDSGPSAGFSGFEAQAQSAFAPQPSGARERGLATVAEVQGAPATSLETPILAAQPSGACEGGPATVAEVQGAPATSLEAPILAAQPSGAREGGPVTVAEVQGAPATSLETPILAAQPSGACEGGPATVAEVQGAPATSLEAPAPRPSAEVSNFFEPEVSAYQVGVSGAVGF